MENETLQPQKIIPKVEIKRKKRIFVPDGSLWWSKTHAMTPVVDIMEDRIRVYFSSLDEKNIGRIGYVDLDKNNPEKVILKRRCLIVAMMIFLSALYLV